MLQLITIIFQESSGILRLVRCAKDFAQNFQEFPRKITRVLAGGLPRPHLQKGYYHYQISNVVKYTDFFPINLGIRAKADEYYYLIISLMNIPRLG